MDLFSPSVSSSLFLGTGRGGLELRPSAARGLGCARDSAAFILAVVVRRTGLAARGQHGARGGAAVAGRRAGAAGVVVQVARRAVVVGDVLGAGVARGCGRGRASSRWWSNQEWQWAQSSGESEAARVQHTGAHIMMMCTQPRSLGACVCCSERLARARAPTTALHGGGRCASRGNRTPQEGQGRVVRGAGPRMGPGGRSCAASVTMHCLGASAGRGCGSCPRLEGPRIRRTGAPEAVARLYQPPRRASWAPKNTFGEEARVSDRVGGCPIATRALQMHKQQTHPRSRMPRMRPTG